MKGSTRKKIFATELQKELKSKSKKTKKSKQGAPEAEFIRMIEESQE